MVDKTKPEYWRSLCIGQTVLLSNASSIKISTHKSGDLEGRRGIVDTIWTIKDQEGHVTFFLINFNLENLFLMIRIVGNRKTSLFLYAFDPDFKMGDRQNLIDNDMHEYFLPPDDEEETDLLSLKFAEIIKNDEFEWYIIPVGEVEGFCEDVPPTEGVILLGTLAQYYCDAADCITPDLLLLEIGDYRNKHGGLIRLLRGQEINIDEAEIL